MERQRGYDVHCHPAAASAWRTGDAPAAGGRRLRSGWLARGLHAVARWHRRWRGLRPARHHPVQRGGANQQLAATGTACGASVEPRPWLSPHLVFVPALLPSARCRPCAAVVPALCAPQIPIAIIADLDKSSRDANAKKPAWFSVYKTVRCGGCGVYPVRLVTGHTPRLTHCALLVSRGCVPPGYAG